MRWRRLVPLLGVLGVSACAAIPAPPAAVAVLPVPAAPKVAVVAPAAAAPEMVATAPAAVGAASWYRVGRGLHRTCSGQMLDNDALTAASPTLPIGTTVRVARMDGGAAVVLLVNDRMPRGRRILDVTEVAARDLGLLGSGVAMVSVTPVMVADSQ